MLGLLIKALGHHCAPAVDKASALDLAAECLFDVLLVSVDPDAPSAQALICELDARGRLPARVITMGEVLTPQYSQRSSSAERHPDLVKPFRLRELEAVLASDSNH